MPDFPAASAPRSLPNASAPRSLPNAFSTHSGLTVSPSRRRASLFCRTALAWICACVVLSLPPTALAGDLRNSASAPSNAAAKLRDLRPLAGTYRDRGLVSSNPSGRTTSLFSFLTGRYRPRASPGEWLELRPSADGTSLRWRLLGPAREVLEQGTLQPSVHFTLHADGLEMHAAPDRGSSTGNLGVGHTTLRRHLRSNTQGLVGQVSRSDVGLLFYLVPVATSSQQTMLWRRRR
ncbi:MAG: hypothetical protein JSR82_20010 [Verrucomicrobia bacterium]|nr:hypothetical protein [Verrucomicrobiota bacterium]